MNLPNKTKIVNRIHKDWGDEPQSKICIGILEYIEKYPGRKVNHLTYGSLRGVIGTAVTDELLLLAIQYLCGERVPVLTPRFEFIDDEYTYVLENEDVRYAKETGEFIHPELGEPVPDYEDKVFMFFEPGSLFSQEG